MKIFYLSAAVMPSTVSHTLSIMRMCQAFADSGHEVVLSAISDQPQTDMISYYGQRGGFQVLTTKIGKILNNKVTRKLMLSGIALGLKSRHLIEQFQPDLVYSRLTLAELFFVPEDIPIVFETHSLGPLGESWWRNLAFRILTKRRNFRRIIVTTNTMADLVRNKIPYTEIVVAPLSADNPTPPLPREIEKLESTFPGKNKFRVGYTGFLDIGGYRGIDILIDIAARMPDVDTHVIGGPDDVAKHWLERIKSPNIHFHGYQKPDSIPAYLYLLDIVLSPLQLAPVKRAPTGKGLSLLKIPQYMSYKKAIVASDLPAHREVLEHDYNALLVPYNDIDSWVQAIRLLKDQPEKRTLLGRNAYQKYMDEFTPGQRVIRILKDLDKAENQAIKPNDILSAGNTHSSDSRSGAKI